jgi:hypothetical protein
MSVGDEARDHVARPIVIEFRPAMRTLIEDAIESLLLLLDEIDGDADLEDDDREDDPVEMGIGASALPMLERRF